MIKKVEGIIISEVDYQEHSKIINVFTRDYGIIGILARGVRNSKSRLAGLTNKLTYGYFHVNYRENGLSILLEVDIIDNFKNIKKDISLISYACFLVELASNVYRHESNKDIYIILISGLIKINEKYDCKVICNIVELKYLDYLGIRPVIDGCVTCGRTDVVTVSSYKGGFLCPSCIGNEKIVLSKTLKLIRMFYYLDISKINTLEISSSVQREINEFIDQYYDRYSGLYLKSKQFLKNLEKI